MASTLRMRKTIHRKQRKMILLKVVQHLSPRVFVGFVTLDL